MSGVSASTRAAWSWMMIEKADGRTRCAWTGCGWTVLWRWKTTQCP